MKTILFLCLLAVAGCSHSIHMVHVDGPTDSETIPTSAKLIEANAEQQVILWFAFDTDYVNIAHTKLLSQCDGEIRAVSSQYSTSHGFLHWTNKIQLKGLCVSG